MMWHFGNPGSGFCSGFPFGGFGHGFFGWIFPLLFWGILIFAGISVIRYLFSKDRRTAPESALDILKKRYAAGEISHQEYAEMKSSLSGS